MGANRLQTAWRLCRYFGPGWLLGRVAYAVKRRSGWFERRQKALAWEARPLTKFLLSGVDASPEAYASFRRENLPPFFFHADSRRETAAAFNRFDHDRSPVAQAEKILAGVQTYFSCLETAAGFPPDWRANPFTGQHAPADVHWSRLDDFGFGDVKFLWEPSRFASAYTLVRAYWRTGDERFAEAFWQLFDDWRRANPPQLGVNWKCGQEASLRTMAWCFALHGLADSKSTTPQRVVDLSQAIAWSAERIEANLSYAVSQNNNHGVSEGVGLWTVGLLFPEFQHAERWKQLGRDALVDHARRLIYDDGSFSQHSLNYQRLMLDDYVWAIRLGELHGQSLGAETVERVAKSGQLLYQLQDDSGRTPNYGANDGALVLPLSNCDYLDYRPTVQAVAYLTERKRRFAAGSWDESLVWLYGTDALELPVAEVERIDLSANDGGYYTLRSRDGFALVRCPTFRHRPAQADLLHVDLWWKGQNIALDAGTYSYNAPPPMDDAFASTCWHNTVEIDGQSQMERAGRFLWLPWAKGTSHGMRYSANRTIACWRGEHDGYRRLAGSPIHRRALLRLGDEHWLAVDSIEPRDRSVEHDCRLHWLLVDVPAEWDEASGRVVLSTPVGEYHVQTGVFSGTSTSSFVSADEHSARGWQSLYYGERRPAWSLELIQRSASARFWTLFGPRPASVAVEGDSISIIMDDSSARLEFVERKEGWRLARVEFSPTGRPTPETIEFAS